MDPAQGIIELRTNNISNILAEVFTDYSIKVTLLSRAVRKADLEEVKFLVAIKGALIDQAEPGGATPLLLAVHLNLLEITKYLISEGASINQGDSYETPLMVATRKSHLEIIKLLVQNGGKINDFGIDRTLPLFWAIKEQNLPVLESLLINSKLLVGVISENGDSPLIFALKSGCNTNIIKCLLKNGAEVNESPLTWAAQNGRVEVMDLLVNHGANPNSIGPDGNTPLAVAVRYRCPEMVKFLLDLEVNVCKVGKNGKTPLLWAVLNQDLEMVVALLDRGADFVADTVFLEAISVENLAIVKKLHERGAFKNMRDKINNVTPLAKALETESYEISKFLLENGATVEDLGGKQVGILVKFVDKGNFEMVKLLAESGTDLNEYDSHALQTPLTKAVEKENIEMVAYFVQKGADVNKANKKNITPLVQATLNNDVRIFQYLVKCGANLKNDPYCCDKTVIRFFEIATANIERENQFKQELFSNQEAEENDTNEECSQAVNNELEKTLQEKKYYIIEFD